jgi:hypothetical protein
MSERDVGAVFAFPFAVIDAALGEFLRAEAARDGTQWRWAQRTSGSSTHTIVQGGTEVFSILVRTMSAIREKARALGIVPTAPKEDRSTAQAAGAI